jgi:hypothetical protein
MEWTNDVKIIVKSRDDKFDVVVDFIVDGNSCNECYSFDTESQAMAMAKHLAKHHELFPKGESKQRGALMDEKVKISVIFRDKKYEVLVGHGNLAPTRYTCETKSHAVALAQDLAKYHGVVPDVVPESKQLEEEATAICIMNTGMEDRFDVGVSYLVTPTADLAMLLATDKYGVEVEVMAERFEMDKVQKPLSKLDQRINELLTIIHKYDNEVNPQAKEYQDALAELQPLIIEQDKRAADEHAKSIQLATCGTCRHWEKRVENSGYCRGPFSGMNYGKNETCSGYETLVDDKAIISSATPQQEPRSCLECALFDQKDGFTSVCGKCGYTNRGIAAIVKDCPHFVGVDS